MPRKKKNSTAVTTGQRRAIARRFNAALDVSAQRVAVTDKRTVRRMERYLDELKENKSNRGVALTPLDVAMRVNELLEHGYTSAAIRKVYKPKSADYEREAMAALLREMHPVYGYRPTAYRFSGVDDETLHAAGIIERVPAKRGPKKGAGKGGKNRNEKGR